MNYGSMSNASGKMNSYIARDVNSVHYLYHYHEKSIPDEIAPGLQLSSTIYSTGH